MATNEQVETEAEPDSVAELRAQLELLAEENERLRDSYSRAKRTQYRRTGLGLAVLGGLSVAGGFAIPTAATVLFSLGGIGLFSAVLTFYLTPDAFVSADVGRTVYTALAGNEADLIAELGLSDEQLYVPTGDPEAPTQLFIPQEPESDLPEPRTLVQSVVVNESDSSRGIAVTPSGSGLFREFEKTLTGELGSTPEQVAAQLSDALVNQFELVSAASVASTGNETQLTVACSGSVYGPLETFDHPVASLLAVGVARAVDTPVWGTVTEAEDSRADYLVTCRWDD